MNNLKTIFITGCSSGFGYLTAKTLLKKGYTIFATMRGLIDKNAEAADKLESYSKDHAGKLHLLELNVTSNESVHQAVRQAVELEGRIDVVVNNAGYGAGGYTECFSVEQLQRIFDVNLFGVHRVNRAVLPAMRSQSYGLLINISSIMGRIIIPFAGPYTASKFALEGLMESMRYELSKTGVEVVIVEPGGFGTGFRDRIDQPDDVACVDSYGDLNRIPEKMWGNVIDNLQADDTPRPQQVVDAVLKLIQMPAGERPFRTVVDPMSGGEAPSEINKVTNDVQCQLLEALGIIDP